MTSEPSGSAAVGAGEVDPEIVKQLLNALSVVVSRGAISKQQVLIALNMTTGVGREAPEMPEFVFESSGKVARIRRLGPFTLDEIRTAVRIERKPPLPPTVKVNKGLDDEPVWEFEENYADPMYRRALLQYEQDCRNMEAKTFVDWMIKYSVIIEPDLDEVAVIRQLLVDMGRKPEAVEAMSDRELYVKHVCIKDQNDLMKLQTFVMGQSIPTEEQVAAAEATFPGDVQEAPDRRLAYAEDGREPQLVTNLGDGDSVVEPLYP